MNILRDAVLVATVPGAVSSPSMLTTELMATGMPITSAPMVSAVAGLEELRRGNQSVDDVDWWIISEFELADRARITFEGITFPASVFVDCDEPIAVTSMFLPVQLSLPAGRHRLAIRLESLTQWLGKRRGRGRWRSALVQSQGLRWARTTLLGRAPVYGDNPAPLGIWRPISVESTVAVDNLTVHADAESGSISVHALCVALSDVTADSYQADITVIDPTGVIVAQYHSSISNTGVIDARLRVSSPQLWWPNGYGSQPIYRVNVHVGPQQYSRVVGFRSVAVDRSDGRFVVGVNGVEVFCRGATWTPVDPINLSDDVQQIRQRLTMLAQAGANMVRVVGGMVYESQAFWEECARLGLLVWQDAMLSTFDPPAELDDVMALELSTVLRNVSGNPALAVVSGGSETIQQPAMLGLPQSAREMNLLTTVFANIAAGADIPYVESSPSAPAGSSDFPLRADSGVSHWFGVGGYRRPLSDVTTAGVRFAAECLAFAIPPSPAAVEKYFGSPAVAGHDPRWKAGVPRDRGSAWDFEDVRDVYVREVFGIEPTELRARDPEKYVQFGRIGVAAAMWECFVHWRTDADCGGALVLAASDLVAGAGWGLIDIDGDAKLPLAVLARAWAPVTLFVRNAGLNGIAVHVINDTEHAKVGTLRLTATSDGGNVVVEGTRDVEVAARGDVRMYDSEITGVFRDLADSYRFGSRVVDAVQVTFDIDGRHMARDVLCLRPGLPLNTGFAVVATVGHSAGVADACEMGADDAWLLTITSSVALRWVQIECAGYSMSDNLFHVAPSCDHQVRLVPIGSDVGTPPQGRLSAPGLPLSIPITCEETS